MVLRNSGQGTFDDVSPQCGDGLLPEFVSRGIALDDLDNDGDVDVVVLNSRDRPTVLAKHARTSRAAPVIGCKFSCAGVRANRDGVGARVEVLADGLRLVDEVHSGRGYQSHWGSVLHFGLGATNAWIRSPCVWIGGAISEFHDLDVDQHIIIIEASGDSNSVRLPEPASWPLTALGKDG